MPWKDADTSDEDFSDLLLLFFFNKYVSEDRSYNIKVTCKVRKSEWEYWWLLYSSAHL